MSLTLLSGGCSCNDNADPCPASFTVGDRCLKEGLVCVWPESKCRSTTCTCENAAGGFYWTCRPPGWCKCTCSCGYTAAVSCESLDCNAKPEDTCPEAVAAACEVVCATPDAGPDARIDGRMDGRTDGRRDGPGNDGPRDARQESLPDAPADLPADTTVNQ